MVPALRTPTPCSVEVGVRGSVAKMNYEMSLATPLAKPVGFATAALTGGFSLQWSF
ncbi:hypothetical protein G5S34_09340 [Herbaspirillum frisingense]|uniref:hypothetical protein n=1 Tax=Herbaspirillum frisingense TaxID=92645 RepID=UPI00160215DE|nr:hypothetical protein [Herbaspirillum frisingense]QNB06954.1 hypothetical protein G5S34_09340 [Herbaspirillum frisingense]